VALVARKRPDFAPGTSWAYSNTNYTLAGMVIERVTGRSLGSELDRRILAPLHMRHTSVPVNTTRIAGRHMNGYAVLGREVRDVTVLNPSGTWAAGNLVSAADDIARFWRALVGGRLLAPPQLTAMKTTVPAFGRAHIGYGLGIMATPSPCGKLWGNGGDIAGYTNVFQNTENGRRQAAVIVDVDPAPAALGEPRGHLRQWSMAAALRRSEPC
jgi:D-alanyl-D-alanine carboxypeptidase